MLQIRLYGGSKTPAKFAKMLAAAGRRRALRPVRLQRRRPDRPGVESGVQIHNLARDTLPYEHEAIEALLAGTDYDDISRRLATTARWRASCRC